MTGKQFTYLLKDKWWIFALGILLIALTFWLFFGDGRNNKNEQLESNIDQQKGVNSVLVNQANQLGNEVKAKSQNTNEAVNAVNQSVNRDSSTFNGNGASDRFCRDFPDDSSCK